MVAGLIATLAALLAAWLVLEVIVRLYLEWPLATDFYSSIPRTAVREQQARYGVQVATGHGWTHLGWIADPDAETYRIERRVGDNWRIAGKVRLGSYVVRKSGSYRVWADAKDGGAARLLGEVDAHPGTDAAPVYIPDIAGPWQPLFRPAASGDYINDHTVYRDTDGNWRLLGITAKGDGDYAREKYFAAGVSRDFPPAAGMCEDTPVADFGELAWAPYVLREGATYHLFWSPHRLHRMTSSDGVHWREHRIAMAAPAHKFFRDAMILKIAEGQWLLYATARGAYFSQIDVYQSFHLDGWQYIGTALRTGWGSERNALFASTESPAVVRYRGRYYLSITYNNDSFVWTPLLLALKIWRDRRSYNNTLVFHSDNPYDFGIYRGRNDAPSLLTHLAAHAAKFVHDADRDAWYITTAGWPWVATLTSGEVAVAPLCWEPTGNRRLQVASDKPD